MDKAALNQIVDWLGEQIGFDIRAVGPAAIERAVGQRMGALNAQSAAEYWRQASTCSRELQELTEAVVVPETWFFRFPESFAALTDFIRREWLPCHAEQVLRVLSIPCSSGEEPYSIAMSLLEAGLAPRRFQIDAVDISVRALSSAQRALYRENAFRSSHPGFRERYFSPVARGYRLAAPVREVVTFWRDNLLRPSPQLSARSYDIIFCRNILIYFNPAAQLQAISNLQPLLKDKGLLFSGPAETVLLSHHGFKAVPYPAAFAFRKATVPQTATPSAAFSAPPRVERRHQSARDRPRAQRHESTPRSTRWSTPRPNPAQPISTGEEAAPSPDGELSDALRLANAGHLQEAAAICKEHIAQQQDSAVAYYVLGLIHDAEGDPQAGAYYRKALYLNPNHVETLAHLALLLDRQGDRAGARRLRARAQRIEEQARK
jgi:chemotaxis protein methyltransferase WspC